MSHRPGNHHQCGMLGFYSACEGEAADPHRTPSAPGIRTLDPPGIRTLDLWIRSRVFPKEFQSPRSQLQRRWTHAAASNMFESMKHWVAMGGAMLDWAEMPPIWLVLRAFAAAVGICIPVPAERRDRSSNRGRLEQTGTYNTTRSILEGNRKHN